MRTVLTVFGTRPEAIKMAPVVDELRRSPDLECVVCVTAQHRAMLDQVLSVFDLTADVDLDVMTEGQSLTDVTVEVLRGLEPVIGEVRPDWTLVHGDTSTTLAASLASFYAKVPVGHVEAGLRTGDLAAPYPEEMNRTLTSRLATAHFAPTELARDNLLGEGVVETAIVVTGNTVVDALRLARERHRLDLVRLPPTLDDLDPDTRLVLVTGHRREGLDGGLDRVFSALAEIATRPDVQVVVPVHPNPSVRRIVDARLDGVPGVFLVEPLEYLPFVALMDRAHVIVTDSGGIQEEAPALGTPVLVTREVTERPEAIAAGTARLVGSNRDRLLTELTLLLDDDAEHRRMCGAASPYGDGYAAARIVAHLAGSGSG